MMAKPAVLLAIIVRLCFGDDHNETMMDGNVTCGDTCQFANDGKCDEHNGTHEGMCENFTDFSDCDRCPDDVTPVESEVVQGSFSLTISNVTAFTESEEAKTAVAKTIASTIDGVSEDNVQVTFEVLSGRRLVGRRLTSNLKVSYSITLPEEVDVSTAQTAITDNIVEDKSTFSAAMQAEVQASVPGMDSLTLEVDSAEAPKVPCRAMRDCSGNGGTEDMDNSDGCTCTCDAAYSGDDCSTEDVEEDDEDEEDDPPPKSPRRRAPKKKPVVSEEDDDEEDNDSNNSSNKSKANRGMPEALFFIVVLVVSILKL